MLYRRLGSSDLEVSEISLGSWLTYGVGVDDSNAIACVDRAFDLGINFFDTSNIYGKGAAESFLAKALKGRDRSSYVLATKLFFHMTRTDYGLSRAQIHKQIDASLKRLNTEYVDLYQCHRYDESTPLEETMEALSEVVREGKTRYIGFSEWKGDKIRASLSIPNVEKFVSSQPQYSMIWRVPEKEVFPTCAANGISQIVWSPLAQGVLTGKYLPGSPPPAHSRAESPEMNEFMDPDLMSDRTLSAVQELKPIATGLGLTLAQLALAWVLRRSNVAASGVKLSAETLEAIDRIALPVQRFSASTN